MTMMMQESLRLQLPYSQLEVDVEGVEQRGGAVDMGAALCLQRSRVPVPVPLLLPMTWMRTMRHPSPHTRLWPWRQALRTTLTKRWWLPSESPVALRQRCASRDAAAVVALAVF